MPVVEDLEDEKGWMLTDTVPADPVYDDPGEVLQYEPFQNSGTCTT